MNSIINDNKITLKEIENFNIKQTLECGQAFRFEYIEEKAMYKLIAKGKVLYIEDKESEIDFYTSKEDFDNIWVDYFDLNRDYNEIQEKISVDDEVMKSAIEYGKGIHILNQDKFEMIISFIISQNNRIPMIKKVIENISRKYGTDLGDGYAFPTLEQLSVATNEELRECKAGFRDKYILDAIEKIKTGEIDIEKIDELPTPELKKELLKIKGVGVKVADCVSLFGYGRREAFPVDVWVKRVMEHFYYNGEDTKNDVIRDNAHEKYGEYGGYAQQYLFYYAREEDIGKK